MRPANSGLTLARSLTRTWAFSLLLAIQAGVSSARAEPSRRMLAASRTVARTEERYIGKRWLGNVVLEQEGALDGGDFLQAGLRQGEELLQLLVREGGLLAAALDFDELAATGHDDVGVDLGVLVLDVVEVEQGVAAVQSDADGGDGIGERVL